MIKNCFLLIGILLLCSCHRHVSEEESGKAFLQAQKDLTTAIVQFEASVKEGRLKQGIETLLNSIPEEKKNAYHHCLLGTLLYYIDKDLSFTLHEKAFKQQPGVSEIVLEYAVQLHRKGKYEEAEKQYGEYLEYEKKEKYINALRADCMLYLDKADKALELWKAADYGVNKREIESAIYKVYGDLSPVVRRDALLQEIRNGKLDNAEELIINDLRWQVDWWNTMPQKELLDPDLLLIRDRLGIESKRYEQLALFKDVVENHEDSTHFKKELERQHLLLNHGALPYSTKIASYFVEKTIISNIMTGEELLQQFGDSLLDRAGPGTDAEALNIYAFLEAYTKGKVSPEIDMKGWKVFHDQRFAESYFSAKEDFPLYDAEFQSALKQFPDSPILWGRAADLAIKQNKEPRKYVVQLVKNEFKTLRSQSGISSEALAEYWKLLEQELNK